MKKKRNNKKWNPSQVDLRIIDNLKIKGYSYRNLEEVMGRDHTTVRKYHLKYLASLNWFEKIMRFLR